MTTEHAVAMLATAVIAMTTQSRAGAFKLPVPTHSIMSITVSRGDCPWAGMTDSYEQEQSNKFVKAVAFDGSTNGVMSSLADFDKPDVLMIRNPSQKKVFVNSRYFSDLHRGDATRLAMGQIVRLGEFRDHTFARLKPHDLVMFLLKSQVIETYWHLEAELKMVRVDDTPAAYKAWFYGVHTYYTNDRNERSFVFAVTVDKKTGEMNLEGGDLLDPDATRGK